MRENTPPHGFYLVFFGFYGFADEILGMFRAIHSGIASYATRAKAQIVGKMKSVLAADSHTTTPEEIEKFGAAYMVFI